MTTNKYIWLKYDDNSNECQCLDSKKMKLVKKPSMYLNIYNDNLLASLSGQRVKWNTVGFKFESL